MSAGRLEAGSIPLTPLFRGGHCPNRPVLRESSPTSRQVRACAPPIGRSGTAGSVTGIAAAPKGKVERVDAQFVPKVAIGLRLARARTLRDSKFVRVHARGAPVACADRVGLGKGPTSSRSSTWILRCSDRLE